jgi:hypothetical protein
MRRAATGGRSRAALSARGRACVAWRGAQAVVMVCSHGMLRLGDDSHAAEALGYSAAGEGGRRGGRNGWCGAAKLSSVLLQNGRKGSGGPVQECPRGGGGRQGVRAWVAHDRTTAVAGPTAAGADGYRRCGTGEERGRGWLACGPARGWGPVAAGGATVIGGAQDGK